MSALPQMVDEAAENDGEEDDVMSRPLYTNVGNSGSTDSTIVSSVNLRAITQDLTRKESLDGKVESALSMLAEGLVNDVIEFSCRLAKHRGANTLHRNDIRLAFEKRLKIRVAVKA